MIPVCIFAKAPEPGRVKTRLINRLGKEGAAKLASAMFQDVWRVASSCPGVQPVLATIDTGTFPVSIDSSNIWLQGEGDLGMRVERILRRGLEDAPAAIALGADSPSITVAHLQSAAAILGRHDAVIGPSLDGGFYLLGVRCCREGLLAHLPWSTCETANATVRRLKDEGVSYGELTPLFDVDTPDDLDLLCAYLRANPFAAPATRSWCIEHGLLEDLE